MTCPKCAELEAQKANLQILLDERLKKEAHLRAELTKATSGDAGISNEVAEVWSYYIERLAGRGRPPKMDPKRRDAIKKCIQAHSVEDAKRAIDGIATYPHVNKGRCRANEGGVRYTKPEHIFRDLAQFEKALELDDRRAVEEQNRIEPDVEKAWQAKLFHKRMDLTRKLGIPTSPDEQGKFKCACPICGEALYIWDGGMICALGCENDRIDLRLFLCMMRPHYREGKKLIPGRWQPELVAA